MVESANFEINKLMIYSPPSCAFPQPDYRQSCVGVEGYMSCTTYLAGYTCLDPSGGNGDSGGYNPYPGNGGGGGGGGSNPTNPTEQPKVVPEITVDPAARQCVKTLLSEIISAANLTGTLRNMMNVGNTNATNTQNVISYLASLNTFTINLSETVIPDKVKDNGDGTSSLTATHGSTNPITGNVTLNTTTLNEGTNLAAAATMIHEIMHSYLVYGAQHLSGEEKMRFEDVNRYIFNSEDSSPIPPGALLSDMQHYQMAETYVNSMASLLESIARINGINNSPDSSISLLEYCKDVFWGSLQQSSGLTPPNPTRAINNAKKEYKNENGSSNVKDC